MAATLKLLAVIAVVVLAGLAVLVISGQVSGDAILPVAGKTLAALGLLAVVSIAVGLLMKNSGDSKQP